MKQRLSPMVKTLLLCGVVELGVWAVWFLATGSVVAAIGYTLFVGPLSLFIGPYAYRRFKAQAV
jgi:hypothetical protein